MKSPAGRGTGNRKPEASHQSPEWKRGGAGSTEGQSPLSCLTQTGAVMNRFTLSLSLLLLLLDESFSTTPSFWTGAIADGIKEAYRPLDRSAEVSHHATLVDHDSIRQVMSCLGFPLAFLTRPSHTADVSLSRMCVFNTPLLTRRLRGINPTARSNTANLLGCSLPCQ